MYKLKMPSGEKVCEYCNVRYPDKRSLMIHEFIHVDQDMDYFLSRSAIESEYLPKAKQLLPNGNCNKRFVEINYRKVMMNIPRCGKRYSKVFLISEAIDELLYLCKKYPLRELSDPAREKLLECDKNPIAEKAPIVLRSPPSYLELSPICSSDYDSSSSFESTSDYSESDPEQTVAQNEGSITKEHYYEKQNGNILPDNLANQISNKESSSDSGYGSPPQQQYSELIKNDSKSPFESKMNPKTADSYTSVEINDLLKNLVSNAADNESYLKSIDPQEFKSIVEKTAHHEFSMQQSRLFDFQVPDEPDFEAFVPIDKVKIDRIHQIQNVVEKVYSMPQILC